MFLTLGIVLFIIVAVYVIYAERRSDRTIAETVIDRALSYLLETPETPFHLNSGGWWEHDSGFTWPLSFTYLEDGSLNVFSGELPYKMQIMIRARRDREVKTYLRPVPDQPRWVDIDVGILLDEVQKRIPQGL
jgi:hypothetical protein